MGRGLALAAGLPARFLLLERHSSFYLCRLEFTDGAASSANVFEFHL